MSTSQEASVFREEEKAASKSQADSTSGSESHTETSLAHVALTPEEAAAARAQAEKLKSNADSLFKKRLYHESQSAYLDAISALPPRSEHDEAELNNLRAILYANLSAAALGAKDWTQAREAATNALKDKPKYAKALHRRAAACEQIGGLSELTEAKGDYETLCNLPDDPPVVTPKAKAQWQVSKQKVEVRCQEALKEETERMKQMGLQALHDTANAFLNPFGWSTKDFGFEKQEGGGYSININRGG